MTETSRPGRHSSWARLMTFPQVLAEPSRAQAQGLAPSAALEPGTSPGAGAAPACSPCGRTPPPLPALQGWSRAACSKTLSPLLSQWPPPQPRSSRPSVPSPPTSQLEVTVVVPTQSSAAPLAKPPVLGSPRAPAPGQGGPSPGWAGPCARARLHWSMCPRSSPCRLWHTPRLVPGEGWQPSHACTLPATPEALPWPVQEPRALPPDRTAPRALAGDRRSSSFSRAHRHLW